MGAVAGWAERVRGRFGRLVGALVRARRYAGSERETAFLLAKSLGAGVLAWIIASVVLHALEAVFAPFSALMVVQATIYRSLYDTARYIGAVLAGVIIAGAIGPVLGRHALSFAITLTLALLIAQWRKLEHMGTYVPTAAIFAYTAASVDQYEQLTSIILMVLLGTGCGIVANLALAPSLRYTSAATAVGDLADSIGDLLDDIADGLSSGSLDRDRVDDCGRRSRQFDNGVQRAHHAVEHSAENVRLNPRRLAYRAGSVQTFGGYRLTVNALDRTSEQLRNLCKGLTRLSNTEPEDGDHAPTLQAMGDVLATLSQTIRGLGQRGGAWDQIEEMFTALEYGTSEAVEQLQRVQRRVDELDSSGEWWPIYGALLSDIRCIIDELTYIKEQRSPAS